MKQIRIPRFLGAVAWMTALLAFMLPPTLYYLRESAALHSEMQASLEVQAIAIMRVIHRSPETWRYQDNLLSVLLAFGRLKPGSERITRIVGERGDIVIASGPMPPLPRYSARQDLMDSGKTVGQVEQVISLRPLLQATAWLTLIGAVAGILLFIVPLVVFLVKCSQDICDELVAVYPPLGQQIVIGNPPMQNSLFDLHATYASLSEAGNPLERLNAVIDREILRPILSGIDSAGRKRPAC